MKGVTKATFFAFLKRIIELVENSATKEEAIEKLEELMNIKDLKEYLADSNTYLKSLRKDTD